MAGPNFLRKIRKNEHLSMASVGRHYRKGVTKQRIAQFEMLERVSSDVERAYRAAVAAAKKELERSLGIIEAASILAKIP